MWREPQRATDTFALGTLRLYAAHPDLIKLRFAPMPEQPALKRLCHWVNRINDEYWATGNRDERSFRKWYRRFIIEEVLDIERNHGYELITEMTLYAHQIDERFKERFGEFTPTIRELWWLLLSQVLVLLGKETRVLAGTRHNVPAWKTVSRIQNEEIPASMLGAFMTTYATSHHVGRDDVWMVPTFREFDVDLYREYERETTYLEVTRDLIEQAFYKQQYIVDPDGVHVKVTNARNITDLYLKVHGRLGSELVDILVRAETSDGAIFFVLTEKALVEAATDTTYFCPGSYLSCLAARVYHDLVTAEFVSTSVMSPANSLGGMPAPSLGDEPTWTVIPRKIRNVVREPRQAVPQRTVTEPHRVTGHRRKAKMTDAHREAIQEFERETGLDIFRFLPEGYTFVRPHFSPAISVKDFATLPRFIRYRIQQSLEAALQAKELRA